MGQVELPHVALREILAARHERDGRRFIIPRTDGFASVGIVSLEPRIMAAGDFPETEELGLL